MALYGHRQRGDGAGAEQWRGIEARRIQFGRPCPVAGQRGVHLQLHGRGSTQVEGHLRPLAVTASNQCASVSGAVDVPDEAGPTVATVTLAQRQRALQGDVASGSVQIELLQCQAGAGPAAAQVQTAGVEYHVCPAAHLEGADVCAIEPQFHWRLQRERGGGVRRGRIFRQVDGDVVHPQFARPQLSGPQRPRMQMQVRLADGDARTSAVVVTNAGQVEWTKQMAVRVLDGEGAVGQTVRPRQGEAGAGVAAEQPPRCCGGEQQHAEQDERTALEPLHGLALRRRVPCWHTWRLPRLALIVGIGIVTGRARSRCASGGHARGRHEWVCPDPRAPCPPASASARPGRRRASAGNPCW